MFRLDHRLVERVDWSTAVSSALAEASKALPPPIMDNWVSPNVEYYATLCKSVAKTGMAVEPSKPLLVHKAGKGFRPVPVLTLEQRVVYTGLANLLKPQLPTQSRLSWTHGEFEAAPLDETDAAYILVTDVSNFYEYIEHGLLQTEIVRQTGDSDATDGVVAFLRQLMGRNFGLPQTYAPSHVLSDVLIDFVERQLIRRGHKVFRYSDDFRVASPSLQSVSQSLQDLTHEARELGLTLNDDKTFIHRRESYDRRLRAPKEIREQVEQEVESELIITVDDYTQEADLVDLFFGPEAEPEACEEAQEFSQIDLPEQLWPKRFLEWWADKNVGGPSQQTPTQSYAYRKLLADALNELESQDDPAATSYAALIVSQEPALTSRVATQCLMFEERGGRAGLAAIVGEAASGRVYLFPWQELWVAAVSRACRQLDGEVLEWLRGIIADPRRSSAPFAAASLTLHNEVPTEILGKLFDMAPDGFQAEVFDAIRRDGEEGLVGACLRESPVYSWVASGGMARG